MATTDDYSVPMALFGTHEEVKQAWLRIFSRAVQDGSWESALQRTERISLAEHMTDIIRNGPNNRVGPGRYLRMYIVHDILFTQPQRLIAKRKLSEDNHHTVVCKLNDDGSRYFWFILSSFCSQGAGYPAPEEKRKSFAQHMLPLILSHWGRLCKLSDRITDGILRGWPWWSDFLFVLHGYLEPNVPKNRSLPPDLVKLKLRPPAMAAYEIRKWIRAQEPKSR